MTEKNHEGENIPNFRLCSCLRARSGASGIRAHDQVALASDVGDIKATNPVVDAAIEGDGTLTWKVFSQQSSPQTSLKKVL